MSDSVLSIAEIERLSSESMNNRAIMQINILKCNYIFDTFAFIYNKMWPNISDEHKLAYSRYINLVNDAIRSAKAYNKHQQFPKELYDRAIIKYNEVVGANDARTICKFMLDNVPMNQYELNAMELIYLDYRIRIFDLSSFLSMRLSKVTGEIRLGIIMTQVRYKAAQERDMSEIKKYIQYDNETKERCAQLNEKLTKNLRTIAYLWQNNIVIKNDLDVFVKTR